MSLSNGNAPDLQSSVAHVQEVIRSAKDELNQLLRDRAAIMKRIGTIKQTLAGLANLFGDSVLSEDLLEQLGRKSRLQQGFTRACRLVLMEASVPLGIREACEELRRTAPGVLERHKHPTASVATVFNRLVQYGEARSFRNVRGRRVWQYIAEPTQATSAVWMSSLALPDNAAVTGD